MSSKSGFFSMVVLAALVSAAPVRAQVESGAHARPRITSTGAISSYQSVGSGSLPYWIKLARSGNVFTMYGSADGVNWVQSGTSQTVSMAQNVYVGLAVSSRSTSALATASFDNVSVTSH
jgi:hypothetical protein